MSPERVARVRRLCAGWVEQGLTSALVVLAARRGVIVLHEAFGRLTPEEDSPPLRLDTLFPLMSLTKPITATVAMTLVEDGSLGLNRPVADYIPEFAGDGKDGVMVHHLLTHTSGLRDVDVQAHSERKKGTVAIPPPEDTQHPWINEQVFLGYDAPLWKAPGQEMSYCNHGYVLVGEIIRRVSGRSLARLAEERIFEPLGMKDTTYVVPESRQQRVVKRPTGAPFAASLNSREAQERPGAAGGVYSTATDLARFGQMFLNRGRYGDVRILSPASVAAMTRNQIPGIQSRFFGEFFPEASWGSGWDIHGNKKSVWNGSLLSAATFSHGGGGMVFLWADPVYELVGVYLSVALETHPNGLPKSSIDLFANAVAASIVD